VATDRFAVATFKRVFETNPVRDVVTLEQLTAGLLRFILKPKLKKAIARDQERITHAYEAYLAGERLGGRRWSIIVRAARRSGSDGAKRAYERLMQRAKGRAKTELRIWSPALYRDGGRRESGDVIHLSCLVLDYDSGVDPLEASAQWRGNYHIVHSTWSHRAEHPRFRLILPLAHAVHADDWRPFWTWAVERTGMKNDPALKSPSSTYALPVLPSDDWPHLAFVKGGELFSPRDEGLVERAAPKPPWMEGTPITHWRGNDPDYKFLDHPRDVPAEAQVPKLPDADDFDLFGEPDPPKDHEDEPVERIDVDDEWDDEFDELF